MTDPFAEQADSVTTPARAPYAITPSDAVPLPICPKAIYVGTGGTLVVRGVDATVDVRFVGVAAGTVIDVRASFVRATGTSASDLIGLA